MFVDIVIITVKGLQRLPWCQPFANHHPSVGDEITLSREHAAAISPCTQKLVWLELPDADFQSP